MAHLVTLPAPLPLALLRCWHVATATLAPTRLLHAAKLTAALLISDVYA